jgi:hypothetical protein
VVRELGPEEEGLRGGGGEEGDCCGGEQGLSVSPDQGADGPKVVGQGRARDNICKKGGGDWGKRGYLLNWRSASGRQPVRVRWEGLGRE